MFKNKSSDIAEMAAQCCTVTRRGW